MDGRPMKQQIKHADIHDSSLYYMNDSYSYALPSPACKHESLLKKPSNNLCVIEITFFVKSQITFFHLYTSFNTKK